MKKIIALLTLICLCINLCACSTNNNTVNSDEPQATFASSEPSTEQLTDTAELIHRAEEEINTVASIQLNNWSTSYDTLVALFVDFKHIEHWKPAIDAEGKRVGATAKLDIAKEDLGTQGSSDYYNAVKDYYIIVRSYLNLVSEFPEGYSGLTYSQTVSDYKEKCAAAYAEIEFYK